MCAMKSCTNDEGEFILAPRNRYTGNGFKLPQAAWVKSLGSER